MRDVREDRETLIDMSPTEKISWFSLGSGREEAQADASVVWTDHRLIDNDDWATASPSLLTYDLGRQRPTDVNQDNANFLQLLLIYLLPARVVKHAVPKSARRGQSARNGWTADYQDDALPGMSS